MTKKKEAKKATKKRHDWDAIKKAYRSFPSSSSLTAFAEKVGVPLRTLQHRMKQDEKAGQAWQRDLDNDIKRETRTMQQRISAGLDKDVPISDEAVAISTAAATNVMVLERHSAAFDMAMSTITEGWKMLMAQVQNGYITVEKKVKGEMEPMAIDVDPEMVGKSSRALAGAMKDVVGMQRHHLGLDGDDGDDNYEDELDALLEEIEGNDSDG